MSTISQLILEGGRARAAGSLARGAAWGDAAATAANFLPGLRARNQADADRAVQDQIAQSQLKTAGLQQQNLQSEIDARNTDQTAQDQGRALALRLAKANDWLTQVASVSDPEQQKALYLAGVQRLSADGTLEPGDAPSVFPGLSWVKGKLAQSLPASERFKQLFPELQAPKTREVRVRNADGSESVQIVEDKPGFNATSAADPTIAAKQKLEADKFAEDQRHNRAMESRAGGSGDQEWVMRNGQLTPIRKGTAQPGDTPYDAVAARQQNGQGGLDTLDYSKERAARTVADVDALMGRVNEWTTGYGTMLSGIPRTDSRAFAAQLNTLKANIAFNELTQMRAASKTGGALGAVSDREGKLLESALGALDTGQSPAEFRAQLQKIRDSITRWQQAVGAPVGGIQPEASHPTVTTAPAGRVNPFRR